VRTGVLNWRSLLRCLRCTDAGEITRLAETLARAESRADAMLVVSAQRSGVRADAARLDRARAAIEGDVVLARNAPLICLSSEPSNKKRMSRAN
jgi:hypothetical protein